MIKKSIPKAPKSVVSKKIALKASVRKSSTVSTKLSANHNETLVVE
ncbi:MAG: hypothetical protein WBE24_17655 [Candidatus Acidiferrum sp.]